MPLFFFHSARSFRSTINHQFLESELELDEELKKLYSVAACPELYPNLVELGCVKSLLGLLTHDNTDVSLAVCRWSVLFLLCWCCLCWCVRAVRVLCLYIFESFCVVR